jgi:hypothetical protein
MNFDDLFPSKWLRASDLGDDPVTVQIKDVDVEKMADGQTKPVVYFKGSDKPLILNVTNGRVLSELYGRSTDNWIGKSIKLVATTTDFQGKVVDCIRLRPPSGAAAAKPTFSDLEDSIPF